MAQWKNLQRIKKFVDPMQLYIACGGLRLEEPGLTAGRLADKFGRGLKFQMLAVDQNIEFSTLLSQATTLFQQL